MVDGYHYSASWPNPANMVTGTGSASRVAFWDGTYSLNSNAELYWDYTNSRWGIGTSSPGCARLRLVYSTPSGNTEYSGILATVTGYSYWAYSDITVRGTISNAGGTQVWGV